MCKIWNIPMEVKKRWARRQLMPWFWANMTAWLYEYVEAYVEAQKGVQCVSAGNWSRSFQASFCDSSNCGDHCSEKDAQKKWMWRERKRRNFEGRPRKKRDVVPPQQLLQKQGDERRSSALLQTKGRGAEVLEDCLQQLQNSYRRVARHWDWKCGVNVSGGGDGSLTNSWKTRFRKEKD